MDIKDRQARLREEITGSYEMHCDDCAVYKDLECDNGCDPPGGMGAEDEFCAYQRMKGDEQIKTLTKAGVVFKVEGEELEWHKSSHWDSLSGDVYYGCQREMKAQGYTLTAPLTGGE